MAKQDDYIRITARIPPEVHDALVQLANRTERSLNGELVARLQVAIALAEGEPRPYKAEQIAGEYKVEDTMTALIKVIRLLPQEKRIALLELLK